MGKGSNVQKAQAARERAAKRAASQKNAGGGAEAMAVRSGQNQAQRLEVAAARRAELHAKRAEAAKKAEIEARRAKKMQEANKASLPEALQGLSLGGAKGRGAKGRGRGRGRGRGGRGAGRGRGAQAKDTRALDAAKVKA